ncbi:hypothetical protein EPN52_08760 [bacterium]|nr:MAG: hypothetical protein EPN52_08760 [bacterium]
MRAGTKWWSAVAVFAAAFLLLSLQEGVYEFSVSLMPGRWHVFPRKVMATIAFALIAYCVERAAESSGRRRDWLLPVLAGTVFSGIVEVAQHYYEYFIGTPLEPLRSSVIDVATGTIGGAIAVWALARGWAGARRVSRRR